MQISNLSEEALADIEDLGKYEVKADSVVVTNLPLEKVIQAISEGSNILLKIVEIEGGRTLRETENGLELVATCHVVERPFLAFRDLVIQSRGRGSYEVLAAYRYQQDTPDRAWRRVEVRLRVNNVGRATYEVLSRA